MWRGLIRLLINITAGIAQVFFIVDVLIYAVAPENESQDEKG